MPRLFMAVRVPASDMLVRVLGRLRDLDGVKAVEPANLHFTLRFLGDVSDMTRDALVTLLARAHVDERPFTVLLRGTSAFPRPERPSVVWAGTDDEGGRRLRDLATHVDRLADEAGLGPRDKPFVPHLTLARIKAKGGRGAAQAAKVTLEERETGYGDARVARWTLVQSVLSPSGPHYRDLVEVPLR